MAVVVSDTSPIRALSHLGCLPLLHDLFGEVLVPPAVVAELEQARSRLPALDVKALPYIRVQAPQDRTLVNELLKTLDPGESEAIALALEVKADLLLMDEAAAREVTLQRGLVALGVLGLLLRAKQKGLIVALAPLLDRLRNEQGFFLSQEILELILNAAGE